MSSSMLQAVLGNAKVASRMFNGWFKGLDSAQRCLECAKACANVHTGCFRPCSKALEGFVNVLIWC